MQKCFLFSEERDESFNRLSTDTYIGKRGVTLKAASMDNPSNLDSNPSEIDPVPSKTASAVGLVAGYSPGQAKRVSSEFLDPNLTPMPSPSPSYVHQDGNENRHLRNTTNPYAPLVKSKTVSCGSSLYNKNPKLKNFGEYSTYFFFYKIMLIS